jgi:hypothetical protein
VRWPVPNMAGERVFPSNFVLASPSNHKQGPLVQVSLRRFLRHLKRRNGLGNGFHANWFPRENG